MLERACPALWWHVCPFRLRVELQLVMEQHLQKQEDMEAGPSVGMEPSSPITEQCCPSIGQWTNYSSPQNNGNEGYTSLLHSAEESMESSSTGGKFHVLLLFLIHKEWIIDEFTLWAWNCCEIYSLLYTCVVCSKKQWWRKVCSLRFRTHVELILQKTNRTVDFWNLTR